MATSMETELSSVSVISAQRLGELVDSVSDISEVPGFVEQLPAFISVVRENPEVERKLFEKVTHIINHQHVSRATVSKIVEVFEGVYGKPVHATDAAIKTEYAHILEHGFVSVFSEDFLKDSVGQRKLQLVKHFLLHADYNFESIAEPMQKLMEFATKEDLVEAFLYIRAKNPRVLSQLIPLYLNTFKGYFASLAAETEREEGINLVSGNLFLQYAKVLSAVSALGGDVRTIFPEETELRAMSVEEGELLRVLEHCGDRIRKSLEDSVEDIRQKSLDPTIDQNLLALDVEEFKTNYASAVAHLEKLSVNRRGLACQERTARQSTIVRVFKAIVSRFRRGSNDAAPVSFSLETEKVNSIVVASLPEQPPRTHLGNLGGVSRKRTASEALGSGLGADSTAEQASNSPPAKRRRTSSSTPKAQSSRKGARKKRASRKK